MKPKPTNGKLAVTNGDLTLPVKIVHWWPGRQYRHGGPRFLWPFIDRAIVRGSRYMTLAIVQDPASADGQLFLIASAHCCPRDAPDRHIGRAIALGRLQKAVERSGWRLQEA